MKISTDEARRLKQRPENVNVYKTHEKGLGLGFFISNIPVVFVVFFGKYDSVLLGI
jgi:hypothetical protein